MGCHDPNCTDGCSSCDPGCRQAVFPARPVLPRAIRAEVLGFFHREGIPEDEFDEDEFDFDDYCDDDSCPCIGSGEAEDRAICIHDPSNYEDVDSMTAEEWHEIYGNTPEKHQRASYTKGSGETQRTDSTGSERNEDVEDEMQERDSANVSGRSETE